MVADQFRKISLNDLLATRSIGCCSSVDADADADAVDVDADAVDVDADADGVGLLIPALSLLPLPFSGIFDSKSVVRYPCQWPIQL